MRRNALLATVEDEHWALVESGGVLVSIDRGLRLQQSGERVKHVFFPISGLLTVGAETLQGETLNVAVLGAEGALGAIEACGSQLSHTEAQVMVAGRAARMSAPAYRSLYAASAAFRSALKLYTEVLLVESRLSIACNVLHTVEMRLARVLLLLTDRARSHELPIHQEALSQLLGVQRTTVSAVMNSFQKQELVRARRGQVTILDIDGLKRTACSCGDTFAFAANEIQASPSCPCDA